MLVADDDVDSAETLAMLLQSLGNEVRTVHDGLKAVEESEAFRPDVALLDACLREGFEEVLAVGRGADGGVRAGTSPR